MFGIQEAVLNFFTYQPSDRIGIGFARFTFAIVNNRNALVGRFEDGLTLGDDAEQLGCQNFLNIGNTLHFTAGNALMVIASD